MARTDLSLAELIEYRPGVAEPSDFDTFWADTLGTTAGIDLAVSLVPVRTPNRIVEIIDVSFAGFGPSHPGLDDSDTGAGRAAAGRRGVPRLRRP
jgi:cephalosporin-C deacetylase-like acetyl esterase